MELVTVRIGEEMLVASPIPAGSFLVRVHPTEDQPYDRMIVVAPSDQGQSIHLCGWIGRPLSPGQWIAAQRALFPHAVKVKFERRRADGTFKEVCLPLQPE